MGLRLVVGSICICRDVHYFIGDFTSKRIGECTSGGSIFGVVRVMDVLFEVRLARQADLSMAQK